MVRGSEGESGTEAGSTAQSDSFAPFDASMQTSVGDPTHTSRLKQVHAARAAAARARAPFGCPGPSCARLCRHSPNRAWRGSGPALTRPAVPPRRPAARPPQKMWRATPNVSKDDMSECTTAKPMAADV